MWEYDASQDRQSQGPPIFLRPPTKLGSLSGVALGFRRIPGESEDASEANDPEAWRRFESMYQSLAAKESSSDRKPDK